MWKKDCNITQFNIIKILLFINFLLFIFYPLLTIFTNMDAESIRNTVFSSNFITAVKNSLLSTMISTVISITLAYVLATCTERVNIKCKALFSVIFILPMLVPSISNGMGLTILLGNNGILTNFLNLSEGIYGLWGIVMGSVLYAFPVAYLMFSDIIRYEDYSPYEAAKVLGIPKFRQFMDITLPYLKKPLITIIFSTFTLIITDYGIPLMIGGKYITIPVVMYQEVIGQLNFGKGCVYGSLLLIPAALTFIVDLLNRDKGNSAYIVKKYPVSDSLFAKIPAYVICLISGIYTLLPIISFILLSFSKSYPFDMTLTLDNIKKTLDLHAGEYLINSLMIAVIVSFIGVIVAFLTAYICARLKSKLSGFLHFSAMASAAIPGVVLGLAYVLAFKTLPIYGTIIILIIVNLVHFISSPYLMIYNSLNKINENLEAVAQTMKISRVHIIMDVIIPLCKNTILEMFTYFFTNCMITISAVSFLANISNKPVALLINQFEAQMQLENASVVSLMILTINLVVKGISYWLKKSK